MQSLREARESRGIKQTAVANALSISRQTYAKYEKDPRIMPVFQAQAACDFIGVPMRDIFFGSNVSLTHN